jgi:hypothetical protein
VPERTERTRRPHTQITLMHRVVRPQLDDNIGKRVLHFRFSFTSCYENETAISRVCHFSGMGTSVSRRENGLKFRKQRQPNPLR